MKFKFIIYNILEIISLPFILIFYSIKKILSGGWEEIYFVGTNPEECYEPIEGLPKWIERKIYKTESFLYKNRYHMNSNSRFYNGKHYKYKIYVKLIPPQRQGCDFVHETKVWRKRINNSD